MKILIADDHTLFRDSLVQYTKRAYKNADILSASNFDDAFSMIDNGLSLLMLDYRMPGMNGMSGLRKVREAYPNLRVVLISGVAEEANVHQAIALGARGYFPKTLSGSGFIEAIELVINGQQYVPRDPKTSAIMPAYYDDDITGDQKASHDTIKPLTPREKDVLQFLSKGASNKEIARELDLQIVTIKLHVRGICQKLGVANRTQAALSARDMGIVRA